MTSEDWKIVALAAIGVAGSFLTGLLALVGTYLSRTKALVNGRMDDLLKETAARAFANGHAAGVAKVTQAVASSPQIPLGQAAVAQAVADTVQPPVPKS